jgi:NADH-quinone oxidoreductase subunit E
LSKKASHILEKDKINNIISTNLDKPGSLLAILKQTQEVNKYNYLPCETLNYIADTLKISRARMFNVVTFYSFFNLTPQGKHIITICRGTACHTTGSKKILSFACSYLGVPQNEIEKDNTPFTTPDFLFTLSTVACFGQCALAPVVEIDNKLHGNVIVDKNYGYS